MYTIKPMSFTNGEQYINVNGNRLKSKFSIHEGNDSYSATAAKGNSELISFLENYSPKTDPLEFCLNQNLLDYKTWETRVAAGLLFHPSPSSVIPRKCAVKITRYETKEDDPERDHLQRSPGASCIRGSEGSGWPRTA